MFLRWCVDSDIRDPAEVDGWSGGCGKLKVQVFFLFGFINALQLYCLFAGPGPVLLVPSRGSASHGQEREIGWRIYWSESGTMWYLLRYVCVYIQYIWADILCVYMCRAAVECMNWRWGIRLQHWSDSWGVVRSETRW